MFVNCINVDSIVKVMFSLYLLGKVLEHTISNQEFLCEECLFWRFYKVARWFLKLKRFLRFSSTFWKKKNSVEKVFMFLSYSLEGYMVLFPPFPVEVRLILKNVSRPVQFADFYDIKNMMKIMNYFYKYIIFQNSL